MADRKTLKSGPTIIRQVSWEFEQKMTIENQTSFDIMLANMAPELFVLWQSLKLYQLNGDIMPPILKAIADIAGSNKLGEVIIEIRPDVITGEAVVKRVRAVDTFHMDIPATKSY
jgi:hypothetical protein